MYIYKQQSKKQKQKQNHTQKQCLKEDLVLIQRLVEVSQLEGLVVNLGQDNAILVVVAMRNAI
jgi:hypothetical protein